MNEDDLRDCFAMFALNGILSKGDRGFHGIHEEAYKHADAMLEARKPKEDIGITTVAPKRTRRK